MDVTRRAAFALMASGLGANALSACSSTDHGVAGKTNAASGEALASATQETSRDLPTLIAQARHSVRANSEPREPLALLHISDVHGDGPALARALAWATEHAELVDDIIATGDLAYQQFSDGMEFWAEVEGADRVLTCVGNHDVYDELKVRKPYDKVSVEDAAAQYVDAFSASWGTIDHLPKTTWYAKDYPERGVRLVVLDCMLYAGEHSSREAKKQNAWLETTLKDARKAGLVVVIAEHFALAEESMVDCSWAPFDRKFAYGPFLAPDVPERVQAFIAAGGELACYLCGHCHCDAAHTLPDHPEQFALTVPCTSDAADQLKWGDMDRSQEQTRNAFDLVMIDVANGLVKVIRIGADRDLALQRRTSLTWDFRRHHLVQAS